MVDCVYTIVIVVGVTTGSSVFTSLLVICRNAPPYHRVRDAGRRVHPHDCTPIVWSRTAGSRLLPDFSSLQELKRISFDENRKVGGQVALAPRAAG